MQTIRFPLPAQPSFVRGNRGYTMHIGKLRIPQSTYLLCGAMVVGLGGGFGAVAFRALIEAATHIASSLTRSLEVFAGGFALICTLAVGGALAAWITARFAPEARGHGVPEVMAAVALRGGVMRPRIILIKALASATTIGFGGAAGREGPIVQIGCAIGSVIGQLSRAPAPVIRTLVACGAAAGISATFNAPIGGVFFASEVIMGDFAPRSFSVIVVSSVVAAVIGRSILGNRPSFDASAFTLVSPRELWLYALLGVIAALWATAFVKILYACEDLGEAIKIPAAVKGAVGFAVVGLMGLGFPQILGVGYTAMQHVLDGHVDASRALELAILKPLATSLTLGAGGSGGVFAPSLFTGAMLGDAFGRLVHGMFPTWTANASAYGLVAMAAVFAAAAEAPITAIVIVFEMCDDYTIILPLMIATVIATILGRRFLNSTVYEMKLERRGIIWKNVRFPHPLAEMTIRDLELAPVAAIDARRRAAEVLAQLDRCSEAVLVIDGERVAGTACVAYLAQRVLIDGEVLVGACVEAAGDTLALDDSLERAATLFAQTSQRLLPVLDQSGRAAGAVRHRDVIAAYADARR